MQPRAAATTVTDFLLRFTALAALTVAVLASVAVRASRDEPSTKTDAAAREAPDTAGSVNDRRFPIGYADAAPGR